MSYHSLTNIRSALPDNDLLPQAWRDEDGAMVTIAPTQRRSLRRLLGELMQGQRRAGLSTVKHPDERVFHDRHLCRLQEQRE